MKSRIIVSGSICVAVISLWLGYAASHWIFLAKVDHVILGEAKRLRVVREGKTGVLDYNKAVANLEDASILVDVARNISALSSTIATIAMLIAVYKAGAKAKPESGEVSSPTGSGR